LGNFGGIKIKKKFKIIVKKLKLKLDNHRGTDSQYQIMKNRYLDAKRIIKKIKKKESNLKKNKYFNSSFEDWELKYLKNCIEIIIKEK
jgi:hypothetical protein